MFHNVHWVESLAGEPCRSDGGFAYEYRCRGAFLILFMCLCVFVYYIVWYRTYEGTPPHHERGDHEGGACTTYDC